MRPENAASPADHAIRHPGQIGHLSRHLSGYGQPIDLGQLRKVTQHRKDQR
jgi:hypothetical protein